MKKTLFALIPGATLSLARAAHAGVPNFTDGDFTSLSDISPYSAPSWSADRYAGDNTIGG
ncbi:MAG TPA: hypothetical protein VN089_16770 [Duganella sp.]|nr:hypothetical protein [Duganella sp.]